MTKKIVILICVWFAIHFVLEGAAPYFIGAYQAEHWAGLTLSSGEKNGFGFFLELEKEGLTASGYDIFHIVKNVGPNSADGSYARLVIDPSLPFGKGPDTPILEKRLPSDTVQWEWSRISDLEAVGRHVNDTEAAKALVFF